MASTGLITDAIRNVAVGAVADAALYITLLKPLTLQAATAVGAATFSVDLAVQAGDLIVFDVGLSSEETVQVQSVSGAGPYTVTPTAALVFPHVLNGANAGMQAHLPKDATTVHEVASITRVAANWSDPSPAGVITTGAADITVSSGGKVGSVALYSAATGGTYYNAAAVRAQSYPSGGDATPTWVESFT